MAVDQVTPSDLAALCDHTFLNRPEGYRSIAKQGESSIVLCQSAFQAFLEKAVHSSLSPYALCVRPESCAMARRYCDQEGKSQLVIASVAGFPDGDAYSLALKVAETQCALDAGAAEIDIVLPVQAWKKGNHHAVAKEIETLCQLAHSQKALLKLILEISELTPQQIQDICQLAEGLGVDFVKTSTGFSSYGATVEAVRLMRAHFSRGIKISGGITMNNVHELLTAASGPIIELNPFKIRIGESSLLPLLASQPSGNY